MIENKKVTIWHPFTHTKTDPEPVHITRGEGVYLIDNKGNRILDAISSWWVNIHGHANPVIAAAIYEQALKLEHVLFAGFTHDPAKKLAEQLADLLPPGLNNVFFSDNGSTAVEVALKLACQYYFNREIQSRNRFIAFENAYHGDTIGAMSAGSRGIFTRPFSDLLFHTDFIDYPSTWIGDTGVEQKEEQSLAQLKQLLDEHEGRHAAVIIEPLVQGAGGMNMCRPEFLKKIRSVCDDHDILLIFDEVMTGFGRTGHWFASTGASVSPDLICLSKGITGGFMPLSVTVAREKIYDAFYSDDRSKTFFHGHSYTANPMACAAALASTGLLRDNPELFTGMAAKHLKNAGHLMEMKQVGKFRICGTIAAWQVKTGGNSGYMNEIAPVLRKKFLEKGILIRPLGDTLYLMPPYIITEDQLSGIYKTIPDVLNSLHL
ncbi:MAG: adenosylmethionine--8-amino-7-oxononanoate transaminase [Rhodothermaceae bacterium]|nr:adenosylmethionine--8-amino-7-oxononanoate transaminase [Rhodothermaceae bacterium]